MIQEYLFLDKALKDELENLRYDNIKNDIDSFGKAGAFIVKYESTSNNGNDAKLLSKINEEIVRKYNPTILTNESSAYFNKRLYPHFNEFERKLRKIIYLASTYRNLKEAEELVGEIESYDFGKIYKNLFTDDAFLSEMKQEFKKGVALSKNDLIKSIHEKRETTIWNKIVGDENLHSVAESFLEIKEYRNHVMHAHNMNYETYRNAELLLKKVNSEIDKEIGKYLNTTAYVPAKIDISGAVEALRLIAEATKVVRDKAQPVAKIVSEVIKALYIDQLDSPDLQDDSENDAGSDDENETTDLMRN